MDLTKNALLLVEDSSDDEALTVRAIKRSGVPCSVHVARHGGDAITELLGGNGPLPHLVVLDYHLPGLNGLEILRMLRGNERTRRLPVVMLSAMADSKEMDECREAGANSCVQKPTDPHAYVENVGQLVKYWFTIDSVIES